MEHEEYMRQALELARQAMAEGEAAGRMRPLRHPGALPHVRRGHRQRPHPRRILRGEG